MKNWLQDLSKDLDDLPSNEHARNDFFKACHIVINDIKHYYEQSQPGYRSQVPWSVEILELVCINAWQWGVSLFLELLDLDISKMSTPYLISPSILPSLGTAIAMFGLGSLEPK